VGAGVDARVFRMGDGILKGLKCFEVDFPSVLEWKNKVLENEKTGAERVTVGVDLSQEDWIKRLYDAGYSSTVPSLWILEGLIMYFHPSDARKLLQTVFSNVSKGSEIMVHFGQKSIKPEQQVKSQVLLEVLKQNNSPILFTFDSGEQLIELLKSLGLRDEQFSTRVIADVKEGEKNYEKKLKMLKMLTEAGNNFTNVTIFTFIHL